MSIFNAVILGLIQGVTEFLPVSSSGHLLLFEKIFNIKCDIILFNLILHTGTLISILLAFRTRIKHMFFHPLSRDNLLILASAVPTFLIAVAIKYAFNDVLLGKYLTLGFMITATLLVFTIVLNNNKKENQVLLKPSKISTNKEFWTKKILDFLKLKKQNAKKGKNKKILPNDSGLVKTDISFKDAIIMGIFQGVAVIPGLSRSGSTIAAGRLLKNDKKKVVEFSFLMSIPIILGGLVLELVSIKVQQVYFLPYLVGFVVSVASGYFSIKFMMKFVSEKSYVFFIIYLVAISIVSIFV